MTDAQTLRARLIEAHEALAFGDVVAAERRARALRELIRVERELTEFLLFQEANNSDRDDEAARDEVLRRIARLVAAEDGLTDADYDSIMLGGVD